MSKEEFKPCPFCGNEPAPYWNGVGCATWGCVLNGLHLDADKWNRRAQPAEAEALTKWKQTAEYWYGQYRFVKHGESTAEYPTEGKLDGWHNSYHNT